MAKKLEDYEWMCPDAFVSITTQECGTYLPCCVSDLKKESRYSFKELTNVKKHSFEDFQNSDYMKKLRQAFKNNNKKYLKKVCGQCIELEKHGLESLRKTSLKRYYDEFKFKKKDLEYIIENDLSPSFYQTANFKSLGQGICNLKCGMCDDKASSARRRESIKLGEINNDYPLSILNHNERFYKDLEKVRNKFLEFQLPTAEPFLVKETYKILKTLDKDTIIRVITNGTIDPTKFIEIAKDFKQVIINISIEGGNKVNSYIRYPSKWNDIIKNFDKLSEYKNFNVSFISTQNALNIGKFTQLKKDIKNRKWNQGSIITYNDPWTISSIPDDIKEIYLNDLYEFGNENMINYLESRIYNENNMIELMKHCKRRDRLRKTYLPDVFPEWKKYYESVKSLW